MSYITKFQAANLSDLHQSCVDEVNSFLHTQVKAGVIDGFEIEKKLKLEKNITIFKVSGTHSDTRYSNSSLKASGSYAKHFRDIGVIKPRSKLKDFYITVTADFKAGETTVVTTANGYQKFVRAENIADTLTLSSFDRRKINPYLKKVKNLFDRLDPVFEARAEALDRIIEKRAKKVSGSPWGVPFTRQP